MTDLANIHAVANAFVGARLKNEVVNNYPGTLPATLADAYAIQDEAIQIVGKVVGGWKVGRVAPHLVQAAQANRIAGPIFADSIFQEDGESPVSMPVLQGFAAAEAEIMLRIGAIPVQANISNIRDYIDQVRFGIEIASSPFPDINEHGPAVTASDFGNNFGLVLGPQILDWKQRNLMAAPVALELGGKVVGTGQLSGMLDGPFGAAAFLVNLLTSRGIAVTPGMWISTGAITGVHKIEYGQSVRATFDNEFEVSCRTTLYSPPIVSSEGNNVG